MEPPTVTPPSTPWLASQGNAGIIPANPLSNPWPQGLNQPVGNSQGLTTLVGNGINAFQRYHPSGYVETYSFDLQYQLTRSAVIEVGYSGTQGRKLLLGSSYNLNQLDPKYLSLGSSLNDQVANPFFGIITGGPLAGATIPRNQLLRPYPQFTSITLSGDTPAATSSFNALNAKYNQRFAGGLSALITFQWSKAIDNSSETQAWEIGDVLRDRTNLSADRSISGHDLPRSLVATIVYELPVGKGKKFGSKMNGVADAVIGGWQLSTITQFSDGLPLQFTAANTLSAYGFNVLRPNITSLDQLRNVDQTPDHWFNTSSSVISAPAPFTLGIRGPLDFQYSLRRHEDVRYRSCQDFQDQRVPQDAVAWGGVQSWQLRSVRPRQYHCGRFRFRQGDRLRSRGGSKKYTGSGSPEFLIWLLHT